MRDIPRNFVVFGEKQSQFLEKMKKLFLVTMVLEVGKTIRG